MTLGMVSSWCSYGTIKHYLREINPDADRINLVGITLPLHLLHVSERRAPVQLLQVASGVSYLHNFKPTVIHGDLKGVSTLTRPTTAQIIIREN